MGKISECPEAASLRTQEGHWESDTVVGKKPGCRTPKKVFKVFFGFRACA